MSIALCKQQGHIIKSCGNNEEERLQQRQWWPNPSYEKDVNSIVHIIFYIDNNLVKGNPEIKNKIEEQL